jgi:Mce-associated membrane protein
MEGDAGASRLNPPPMPSFRRLRRRRPKNQQEPTVAGDQASAVTAEDAEESADATDETRPAEALEDAEESADATDETRPAETLEDSAESADATDETGTDAAAAESVEADTAADAGDAALERGGSRLGRGWLVGIAAALVLCAGALGFGGWRVLQYHQDSQVIARSDAAALKAAVECVSATQAPDTNAMVASEQKIIDCGTDAFRSQALLYTSMLVQAYQAANVHVQVSDVRAAVERNNNDGSVEVLVAMRVKVTTDKSQNETGYRLRAKMAMAEGQYRISKLEQVTK